MPTLRLSRRFAATFAAALGAAALAVAAPASAATVSASLGPIPVPNVPVTVCVNSSCVTTPPATSITLSASVSASGVVLPTVVPGSCPSGSNGLALTINTLTQATVSVTGSVTGTEANGTTFSIPIGPVSQTVGTGTPGIAVSACTT